MKFRLEIDMEKVGMGSGWTIANALREAAHQIESAHDSNRGVDMKHWDEYDQKHSIRAETGDTVGKWEVTEDAPSPADRAIVDALPSPPDTAKERTRIEEVADALRGMHENITVTLEGGGAQPTFIGIALKYPADPRLLVIGNEDGEWDGLIYPTRAAFDEMDGENYPYFCADVSPSERNPVFIADRIIYAMTDVCIAGNPALLGRCGQPDCVCSSE